MNYSKNASYNYELTDMYNSIGEAARFYKYYVGKQDVNKNQHKQRTPGESQNKVQPAT